MLKSARYLLFPISLLYGLIIKFRNWLFDKGIIKSASFNFPIICVGNLATGGTGKTPMTEYLIELLQPDYQVATISRGYKRKTKGFAIAGEQSTALEIGDEPMQFHQKYPDVTVAVGEERLVAVPQLLHDKPGTEVIILDDAFQHRRIKAGLNILLTDYNNMYTRDFLLPAGDLRDVRSSALRTDIIIVTKCPAQLAETEKNNLEKELRPTKNQKVYFTEIAYPPAVHLFNLGEQIDLSQFQILLVCGIANPAPLQQFLTDHTAGYDMLRFADHHIFTSENLKEILKDFEKMTGEKKIILTTEKDAVRLHKFKSELQQYPVYVLPIVHRFLFQESDAFATEINSFVKSFAK